MNHSPPPAAKKRLAVFKFASCDGCQLSLLNCEDELLPLADRLEISHFLEASSKVQPGPYDIALVEGSISTEADLQRVQRVREQSKKLVAIGACATAGGIQALRNWADHPTFLASVYAKPEYIDSLATSTPIAAHVPVDFELAGCPVAPGQLLEVIQSLLADRKPRTPRHSVCIECKRRGTVCLAVTKGVPCLGPLTQAGCNALCPAYDRGCYGCFGPASQANCQSLNEHYLQSGITPRRVIEGMRHVCAGAQLFQIESDRLETSQQERD